MTPQRFLALAGFLALPCHAATTMPTTQPTDVRTIVLTADAAEPHGTLLATTRPAYTGAGGYATGFDGEGDRIVWHLSSAAGGLYQAEVRYAASAHKGYELVVNGVARQGFFAATGDAFATSPAGKLELRAGDNTIEIRRDWGHYDIDRVELIPTVLPLPRHPPAEPVDPHATPAARSLLKTLVDDYGKTTRSGVVHPSDANLVEQRAGVTPAIMGGDLIDYSPSRVERGAKSIDPPERLIQNDRDGYLLTVMWHWNAPGHLVDGVIMKDGKPVDMPWHRAFYAGGSTFDLPAALDDPAGADYQLLLRDIDAIAVQLKKYSDADVPILWRPLHEADGRWFWWGERGPEAFKRLWALMFDRLTNYHGLHNLIWVYTGTTDWDWYPPAEQFDLIGVDAYPHDDADPCSAIWDALDARWGDRKLLALTEFGGVPDLRAMARLGVRWSYFASWGKKLGPDRYEPARLRELYHAPTIANRPTTGPATSPATTRAARSS